MRLSLRSPLRCLVFLATGLLLLGCTGTHVVIGDDRPRYEGPPGHQGPPPWAPAHGYRAKHQYRYYPDSYVYYDTGRGLYFYYDGGNWQAGVNLPASIHIDLNDYVVIESDTDRPYEYHTEIMDRYPPGQAKKGGRGKDK